MLFLIRSVFVALLPCFAVLCIVVLGRNREIRLQVGPGQPVLLVEQYCQPICYTRRVFISVLHVSNPPRPRLPEGWRRLATTL